MIRAYFYIRLDGAYLPAPTAQDIADMDAARTAARTIVRGLMRQHGGDPRLLDAALVIADEAGTTLLEMSFLEALYLPVEPVNDPNRRRPIPREFGAMRTSRMLLSAAMAPIRRFAATRAMR